MTVEVPSAGREGPAGDALESAMREAMAELNAADAEPKAEGPTTQAQDSAPEGQPDGETETESGPAEGETPTEGETPKDGEQPEEAQEPKSGRAKNRTLAEKVAAEKDAEYQGKIDALTQKVEALTAQLESTVHSALDSYNVTRAQTQTAEETTRNLRQWTTGHKADDWQATRALADWAAEHLVGAGDGATPPAVFQTLWNQGRAAAHREIAESFAALKDTVGADAHRALLGAKSVAELVTGALEHGKRAMASEKDAVIAERDERIALLEAQLTETRGKLSGQRPSPEGPGGARSAPARKPVASFEDAWAQAKAEHGVT